MVRTKEPSTLRMMLAKKAIASHFNMERARILQFIETVHVEGKNPVQFSTEELASIQNDMLLFLVDAARTIKNMASRVPNRILQKGWRAITLLRAIYNDPIPADHLDYVAGGTTDDVDCLLGVEWSCITPVGGGSPTVSTTKNIPGN